jgi:hypothetical protein
VPEGTAENWVGERFSSPFPFKDEVRRNVRRFFVRAYGTSMACNWLPSMALQLASQQLTGGRTDGGRLVPEARPRIGFASVSIHLVPSKTK